MNKGLRRVLVGMSAVVLAVLFNLGSFGAGEPAAFCTQTVVYAAAKKPSLNKTEIMLKKGETFKIKVKGLPEGATVKFTSSNKSVATVLPKKGKVTAVSAGTATITAKVTVPDASGSKTYKLKTTVTVKAEQKKGETAGTYTPGMKIENVDEFKLVARAAVDKLEPVFKIKCPESLTKKGGDILLFEVAPEEVIAYDGSYTTSTSSRYADTEYFLVYSPTFIESRYIADPSLKSRVDSKILGYDAQLDKIRASIFKTGMTDREKVEAIHDYIIRNYAYVEDGGDSHEFYGALKNGYAVCQGFSYLFRLILQKEGILVEDVTGDALSSSNRREPHQWNRVWLEDTWYYVDVTFDMGYTLDDAQVARDFFMKTFDEFYRMKMHFEIVN